MVCQVRKLKRVAESSNPISLTAYNTRYTQSLASRGLLDQPLASFRNSFRPKGEMSSTSLYLAVLRYPFTGLLAAYKRWLGPGEEVSVGGNRNTGVSASAALSNH